MDSVDQFLLGLVALLGFGLFAEHLFKLTRLPDALWLIIVGVVIGPLLGWVDADQIKKVLPYFAVIALIVILFNGGSQLSFRSLRDTVGRAGLLAATSFGLSFIAISAVSWIGYGMGYFETWSWTQAMILGAILGGSSSIIIMPTVALSGLRQPLGDLVSVESAITDAFCIVATSLLLSWALQSTVAGESLNFGNLFLTTFGVALVTAVIAAVAWLMVLPLLSTSYSYLLTLMYLFVVYVISKNLEGSPALTILLFAVMMGNARWLGRLLKLEGRRSLDSSVKFLNEQVSFVLKTFFFVMVGVLFHFSIPGIILGVVLTAVIAAARIPATQISLWRGDFSAADRRVVVSTFPRGLAAGVLATVPAQSGMLGMERLSVLVFDVITISICAFALVFFWARREGPQSPQDAATSAEAPIRQTEAPGSQDAVVVTKAPGPVSS